MDSGHKKYDNPEPRDQRRAKAVAFGIGALVVVAILYLLSTGTVEIFH